MFHSVAEETKKNRNYVTFRIIAQLVTDVIIIGTKLRLYILWSSSGVRYFEGYEYQWVN